MAAMLTIASAYTMVMLSKVKVLLSEVNIPQTAMESTFELLNVTVLHAPPVLLKSDMLKFESVLV